ncbi:expressed unknown protein [Seminavis robusta]|uniref:Aquaporin n=1 Tax=Seminavis robusta TaxID=568900 RepID=A0A9N8E3Q4_9STRA|nr:expressed unknown protein [Seminavis robusta]|eukprot:Sro627_g177890.1 n/a (285) ;mRNA; r:34407-35261
MVKDKVATASTFFNDCMTELPPGVFLVLAFAYIENGKYLKAFRHEFIGTLLMISCTFSAGKWIGQQDMKLAWTAHAIGVIAADWFGGGPHVNPAMTTTMWALGKCTYTEGLVRIAGQMGGGLIAFPFFHAVSNYLGLEPFGGPEFNMESDEYEAAEAALSEFCATMLLAFAIYILNWELNFGSYHYIIKQFLTAVAIRALIEMFPTAGPAMNPMLATAWAAFGVGAGFEFPENFSHYFVYWVAPCVAAIVASFVYAVYSGESFFGSKLPIGPIKPQPAGKVKKN